MKTVKLSKSQIKKVEKWLKWPKLRAEGFCPFHDKHRWYCGRICRKLFPRLLENWYPCPCHCYSYSHVRRVAINLLKSQV